MQYVEIKNNTSLTQLRNAVGSYNIENVLAVNMLKRTPNIGQQVLRRNQEIISTAKDVKTEYKVASLGKASSDSDVFEKMALMGESGWKILKTTESLPGTIKVPDHIKIAKSENVLGNHVRVDDTTYRQVIDGLSNPPHTVDPSIFNTYSSEKSTRIIDQTSTNYGSIFQFFKIPWGSMSIYSSISNTYKDFPVYPEEVSDSARANYTTMPEIIYQYEPWQLYTSSGPRSVSYSFTFHRDMWTGDHRDGKANELVRFCMSNCYPEYNGSAVNTALTSLYMNGQLLIRGILNDVSVTWDGPLGLDNYYLVCKLQLSFTEVSPYTLDYWTIMQKPLIG